MRIRRRDDIKVTAGLMLTPMLDVLTVVLIFLILNFSPEKSQIQKMDSIQLPKAEMQLQELPRIRIEVSSETVRLNGKAIEGLNPQSQDASLWASLKSQMDSLVEGTDLKSILLLADRETQYDHVDRTVARLAQMGYGDVYLLTELEERQ